MFHRGGPAGAISTYAMTEVAGSPIAGSRGYTAFSHPRVPLLPDPPIATGNIAHYEDRMRWIREEIWPAHQHLIHTPGAVQGELARPFDERVDRFRLVEPPPMAPPIVPPVVPAR